METTRTRRRCHACCASPGAICSSLCCRSRSCLRRRPGRCCTSSARRRRRPSPSRPAPRAAASRARRSGTPRRSRGTASPCGSCPRTARSRISGGSPTRTVTWTWDSSRWAWSCPTPRRESRAASSPRSAPSLASRSTSSCVAARRRTGCRRWRVSGWWWGRRAAVPGFWRWRCSRPTASSPAAPPRCSTWTTSSSGTPSRTVRLTPPSSWGTRPRRG